MADKKLPPGSTTEIVLRRKPKRAPSPATAPARGIVPIDDEPARYIRRFADITFYDLGTRKQDDGSYADILRTHLVSPYDLYSNYHTTLLQGDYLASGACLKIPQAAQYLYFDTAFLPSNLDLDTERNLVGVKNTRPLVQDFPAGSLATETKWRNASLPFRPPADSGDWYLSIESA